MMLNKKAVALVSGGLDSILAVKLALEQGLDVYGLKFFTPFCKCHFCLYSSTWKILNIPLEHIYVGQEYIDMVRNPKYGYGSNMNPCIDCRIFFFSRAKEYMVKIGATFIITGEVLDERPMTQRKEQLKLIERESGLEGLVLRPLSAKLLPMSLPEIENIVDREKLLDIRGRSRKRQIELAYKSGIFEFPQPAGGCLLTDPQFSKRIKDLFKYSNTVTVRDIELLKIGRHFRLDPLTKLIIPRDENENMKLINLIDDRARILSDKTTPIVGLYQGDNGKNLTLAASIYLKYISKKTGLHKVIVKNKSGEIITTITSTSLDNWQINNFKINK